MFGKKKNILDVMTARYEKIQKESDAGARLIGLNNLKDDVESIIKEKKKVSGEDKVVAVGMLGTITTVVTGVTLLTPAAWGVGADVFVGIVSGVAGLLASGSFFIDANGGAALGRKLDAKAEARYIRDVMPHVPGLEDLSAQITNSQNVLLSTDEVIGLQQSKELPKLLLAYPDLKQKFKEINQRQYEDQKSNPTPGGKELQL